MTFPQKIIFFATLAVAMIIAGMIIFCAVLIFPNFKRDEK